MKFNDSYYNPTVFYIEYTVCRTYKTLEIIFHHPLSSEEHKSYVSSFGLM
jgi:hypothetical protein